MKGKNLRLKFSKPVKLDHGIQFKAERKLKEGWACGRYTLPKAQIKTDESGNKYIHIDEGPIGAKPSGNGIGSSLLRQTHSIFREIARRTQMDVLHVTTPANLDSRRFFEKHNKYTEYKPAEYARKFQYRGGKPRERSENIEKIMHALMGDKFYWESRKALKNAKK